MNGRLSLILAGIVTCFRISHTEFSAMMAIGPSGSWGYTQREPYIGVKFPLDWTSLAPQFGVLVLC
jgi:hypothetical protein